MQMKVSAVRLNQYNIMPVAEEVLTGEEVVVEIEDHEEVEEEMKHIKMTVSLMTIAIQLEEMENL